MGIVWQAYDELLQRDVAVKEVHFPPDLSSEDRERLANRTLREARAVAAVETQAAVRVFDVVEQDGRPWIVMELVRGRTLTELLHERSPLPPAEVAAIGLALVEALEVAHAAGVLHRDVKPGNVLIGEDGRIALTDFGIATVDGDDSDNTTTGVIVGSPAYVAPERVHGEPSTTASDLWSLGATLWTAAEGRPPYAGETAIAVMSSVAMKDAPSCARCGGPLGELLRQLMDRDPSRRPDASTVRQTLAGIAADRDASLLATEPYPTERLPMNFDRTTVLASVTQSPRSEPAPPAVVEEVRTSGTAPTRRPAQRGRGASRWVLGVAAAVVLLVLVAGAVLFAQRGDDTPTGTKDRTNAKSDSDNGSTSSGSSLPDGLTRYRDPDLGWTIGVPEGWQQTTTSNGTRFDDPAGGRYLLVATRYPAGSSAVGAWEDSERAFRSSHTDYQRLRLEPIDVSGASDAADWEFTYTEGGAALHAIDRAIVVGNRGYGLYFQTHEDQWDASQSLFESIDSSFNPA
jgi:serine/threonine protein kinase